jgi:hypothetical protein
MTVPDLLDRRQRLALIVSLTNRWIGQDESQRMPLHDGTKPDADPTELADLLAVSQTRLDVIRYVAHGRIPDTEETL